MGNLIRETPYSEITATLEVLDRWGVERDDLVNFRKASSYVQQEIACLMKYAGFRCKHCGGANLTSIITHEPVLDEDAVDEVGRPYRCRDCEDRKYKGAVRLFVDYTRPLAEMIKACGFDSVNSNIIEKHYPVNKRSNAEVEMKVFSTEELVGTTRSVTSKEVIQALESKGYREAELPEGLAYAKANPDEQREHPIVILGFVWRHWDGRRNVPCLDAWDGERKLILHWFEDGWCEDYRFLGVRK